MDFVLADKAQTGAIYFMASEEDLITGLSQPGQASVSTPGKYPLMATLRTSQTIHANMGSMPRFLGHYVRDQHLYPRSRVRKIPLSRPQREPTFDSRGLAQCPFLRGITIFER